MGTCMPELLTSLNFLKRICRHFNCTGRWAHCFPCNQYLLTNQRLRHMPQISNHSHLVWSFDRWSHQVLKWSSFSTAICHLIYSKRWWTFPLSPAMASWDFLEKKRGEGSMSLVKATTTYGMCTVFLVKHCVYEMTMHLILVLPSIRNKVGATLGPASFVGWDVCDGSTACLLSTWEEGKVGYYSALAGLQTCAYVQMSLCVGTSIGYLSAC